MHRNAAQCSAMHRNAAQRITMQRNAAQCSTMQHNAAQCSANFLDYSFAASCSANMETISLFEIFSLMSCPSTTYSFCNAFINILPAYFHRWNCGWADAALLHGRPLLVNNYSNLNRFDVAFKKKLYLIPRPSTQTIASPHLGVYQKSHNFLEDELGLKLPTFVKSMIRSAVGRTGQDLVRDQKRGNGNGVLVTNANIVLSEETPATLQDTTNAQADVTGYSGQVGDDVTLLYRMSTDDAFLRPLRGFLRRRVYANM
jgi:hypothetical protein